MLFQNLAAEKTYNDLDVSLHRANEHRNEWFEGVQKCTLDETLYDVMERIVRAEVNSILLTNKPYAQDITRNTHTISILYQGLSSRCVY